MSPSETDSAGFTARRANRHQLYELAVQQPVLMVEFLAQAYEQIAGREPITLREDFAGTANLAATWVCSSPERKAVAVEIDPKMIAYAERHNRSALGEAGKRLKLIESDVRKSAAKADVLTSLNFSHYIYHTRADLLSYFRHARRCLKPDGIFVLDAYGGPGSYEIGTDERDHGDFIYQWEQASFDPLNNRVVNHIHFVFPDGSKKRKAFTYDWRLWSIAELR
ncbi:MAG: methyltransferase, partial [Phycisphaeraceae bacterium]